MAIEKQLIYREDLLAEYDRVHIGEPGKARKLIEDAPAVREWIPVSERLPEDFVSVLGYMTDAGPFPSVRECYKVGYGFYFPALREIHPVSHWMPMPKPTEEVKHG